MENPKDKLDKWISDVAKFCGLEEHEIPLISEKDRAVLEQMLEDERKKEG